jgi:hypothetical protein
MLDDAPTQTRLPEATASVRLAQICQELPAGADLETLLAAIQAALPELELRQVLTRSGWHRLGGVVDRDGQRIAHHLADWAEAESGGDIDELLFKLADVQYFATRFNGRTHYLVAPTGPLARDFVQIEIEELQEVLDRTLTDPDWFPETLAEFVDPFEFPRVQPDPIGAPRFVFRRLTPIADLMDSPDAGRTLKRFLADWDRSSAAESEAFCHQWVLAIREYLDRDGEGRLSAKPVSALTGRIPTLPDGAVARGAKLANQIHGFDREAGYPFAWYFHMLTSRAVSHKLAEAVHSDLMGAYDYLPARDLKILRDWYREPYGL